MPAKPLTAPPPSQDAADDRETLAAIESRLLRVEHAIAELGENSYQIAITSAQGIRGKPHLTELIRERRAWVQAAKSLGVSQ